MDTKPFLEFNMLDIQEPLVEKLKELTKSVFDIDQMLTSASELKYTREIKLKLEEQFVSPSEEFVRFLGSQIYDGRMTQTVLQQFATNTQRALKQFLNEQINKRLKSALAEEKPKDAAIQGSSGSDDVVSSQEERDKGVVTSEEELQGYYVVKAIMSEVVDLKRVAKRDTRSYFGILLDDSNPKPICRLYFNTAQKYLGLFDNAEKREDRIPVESLDDIYKYKDRIKAAIAFYDKNDSQAETIITKASE